MKFKNHIEMEILKK